MKKIKFVDNLLTPSEFCKHIERKIRKNIRDSASIKPGARIYCPDELSTHFIEAILKLPKTVVKQKNKATMLIDTTTLDDVCEAYLSQMFGWTKKKIASRNDVCLFKGISSKDLTMFAKLKKIKYLRKTSVLIEELDALEKQYPGTKNALYKTATHK